MSKTFLARYCLYTFRSHFRCICK